MAFKIAIIGTGAIATTLTQCFAAFNNPVNAICGRNENKTQTFAQTYKIEKYFTDIDKLLSADKYNLICIATPNSTHLEIFKKVIQTDSYILLEKPAGINPQEVKQMLDLAKSKEDKVLIDHELRFNPYILKIKELIDSGKLGNVSAIHFSTFLHHNDESNPHSWMDDINMAGGQMLLAGSHLLDTVEYLLDYSEIISGKSYKNYLLSSKADQNGNQNAVTTEQQYSAIYSTKNSTDIFLFNSAYSFGFRNFEIKVMGNKGLIIFDDVVGLRGSFSAQESLQTIKVEDPLSNIEVGRSIFSKSVKYLIAELFQYITVGKNNKGNFCTLRDSLVYLEYLEKYQN